MAQASLSPQAPQIEDSQEKLTYQAFLKAYQDIHAEWIAGEVIAFMPASDRHQGIVRWLIAILSMYVETHELGWLRPAPFNMYLPHLERGREPDILFVTQERLHIVQQTHLSEAADLVIEIVSPESISRDQGEKYVEYEKAGIREYWLIDPEREQAEFYHLSETGHYQLCLPDPQGRFHAKILPGFWLQIDWLWQKPLPKVLKIAQTLGLVS